MRWDWRVFQGWKERQTPSRPNDRPVGGLKVFRSKLWWGLLLDEHKRTWGRKLKGPVGRYRARMVAAGWVEGGDGIPPANRTVCGAYVTNGVAMYVTN